VDEYGNVLSKAKIAPDRIEDQYGGIGFWERSVSSSKIDLLFLIDKTGSMTSQIQSIKSELKEFVNRLEADACDFRAVVLQFEASSLEEPGKNHRTIHFMELWKDTNFFSLSRKSKRRRMAHKHFEL
jgi:hypothetical protein